MIRIMIAAMCILLLTHAANADNATSVESRKIEYLISAIESLTNAKFIRNGTAYDAKSAAEHLRLKWKNAGSKVVTAEDFIRLCGAVSSMSGKPYEIRYADGRAISSESFLRAQLSKYVDKYESVSP